MGLHSRRCNKPASESDAAGGYATPGGSVSVSIKIGALCGLMQWWGSP